MSRVAASVTVLTLISLVGFKVFERRLKKDWYKEMTIVSRDEAGQLNRIQETITRHQFEIVNFGLKKDLERQEVRASFILRVPARVPGCCMPVLQSLRLPFALRALNGATRALHG